MKPMKTLGGNLVNADHVMMVMVEAVDTDVAFVKATLVNGSQVVLFKGSVAEAETVVDMIYQNYGARPL